MGSVISVVIWFGCFWLVGFGWFSRVMTLLLGLSKAVIWFIEPGELIFPNLGLARLFPLWLLDHCLPSRRHVPSRCSFLYRRCHCGYCRIVHKMIRKASSVTASGWMQLSYCQVRRDRFQLIALQVVYCRGFFFLSLLLSISVVPGLELCRGCVPWCCWTMLCFAGIMSEVDGSYIEAIMGTQLSHREPGNRAFVLSLLHQFLGVNGGVGVGLALRCGQLGSVLFSSVSRCEERAPPLPSFCCFFSSFLSFTPPPPFFLPFTHQEWTFAVCVS